MKILLTNDDGINAAGINALAEAVAGLGEVFVVAPDREQSAAGHSLTLNRPLRIEEVGENRWSVDGTPTDCVNVAIHGLLKFVPDLVISGINHGENLGDDVTYSGTVAGALEGLISGAPSIAISLAMRRDFDFGPPARLARKLAEMVIMQGGLPADCMLNVNHPNTAKGAVRGVRVTHQGKRRYGDIIVEKTDPRGKKYYWIGGEVIDRDQRTESDIVAVAEGFISITPLHIDMTNYQGMEKLRSWNFDDLSP